MNAYNLFRYLEQTKGKRMPFKVKATYAPDTFTPEELNIKGDLNLDEDKFELDRWGERTNTLIQHKDFTLPENLTISGDLKLGHTPIKTLPKGLKIGGTLHLTNTLIEYLPPDIEFHSLFAYTCALREIPPRKYIHFLCISQSPNLKRLPDNLTTHYVDLNGSSIIALPRNFTMTGGGTLDIGNTHIKILPYSMTTNRSIIEVDKSKMDYFKKNFPKFADQIYPTYESRKADSDYETY